MLSEIIKDLDVSADGHRTDKDTSKDTIRGYANCLLKLRNIVKELRGKNEDAPSLPNNEDILKESVPSLVIAVSAHTGKHYWTNTDSRRKAFSLLNEVLMLCGCSTITELLLGVDTKEACPVSPYSPLVLPDDDIDMEAFQTPLTITVEEDNRTVVFRNGIMKKVMAILKKKLQRDSWKSHPNSKQALIWCLKHLKHPEVDPFIDDFLPSLLMLVDDHEAYHRSLGLSGLTHLIKNCNSAVLKWYNRCDVIYDAIKHLIYTNDVVVITALHPCLLCLLPILNGPPPLTIDAPRKPTKTDEVFTAYLGCMEMESKLAVRKAYSCFMADYIQILGIFTIRYLKRLLCVIFSYIENPDYCGEQTRLNSLKSLVTLIKHCWPRIPSHSGKIFEVLVKLMSDLSSPTPNGGTISSSQPVEQENVGREITTLIKDCLVLLVHCHPQIKVSYEAMLVKYTNEDDRPSAITVKECIEAAIMPEISARTK